MTDRSSRAESQVTIPEKNEPCALAGEPVEWNTVYGITLRGDRVLHGRVYFDRLPVLARMMPDITLREAATMGVPGVPMVTDLGEPGPWSEGLLRLLCRLAGGARV